MQSKPTDTPFFIDVILPLALPKAYTYATTQEQAAKLKPGFRVAVPFGKQKIYTAIVVNIHRVAPQTYTAKPIAAIMDDQPVVTPNQLDFWSWIASYYMCTQGEVLRACLPSAMMIESQTLLEKGRLKEEETHALDDDQFLVFEALEKKPLTLEEVASIVQFQKVMPLVLDMIEKGAVTVKQHIEEKFIPKTERCIKISAYYQKEEHLSSLFDALGKAPKQSEVLMALFSLQTTQNPWVTVAEVKKKTGCGSGIIRVLIDKGWVEEIHREVAREIFSSPESISQSNSLSPAQQNALNDITESWTSNDVVLFEGVTSSGKTEVYIHLIEEQIKAGNQVLYLVPEIVLTPQVVTRLVAHFGDKVSVYHSKFSIHERVEVWKDVLAATEGKVIVGARSALFLPFQELKLILVDEEHENSYKQFDPAPRYHARDSAIYLAQAMQAKVLLGSATPSLESAENARTKKYGWVKLEERFGGVSLPLIESIDLREAHRKQQMEGMFSTALVEAMQNTLALDKQIILFQNRRGYAPILECLSCGHSPQCTQCDVTLTYHQTQQQLRCHYCGYHIPMPTQCHACGMPTLTTKGVGTQQIEEQVNRLFPDIQTARMDWDSTRGKWSFDKIIASFSKGDINILIGTQMVVKGLDFKNVLLVGVINADQSLNFPDFRAHERSFQMLCQVAGRAGRSDQKGKVLIQTYQPEHPILTQVKKHDYNGLYQTQKAERIQYQYPPYTRMIKVTFKSRQIETVNTASEWYANVVKQSYSGSVLGPVFPPVARVRNVYIKHLMIKADQKIALGNLKKILTKAHQSFQSIPGFRSTKVIFDVDPY